MDNSTGPANTNCTTSKFGFSDISTSNLNEITSPVGYTYGNIPLDKKYSKITIIFSSISLVCCF